MVEHWLPKPRVAGSSPVFRSIERKILSTCAAANRKTRFSTLKIRDADMAQLVEQRIRNAWVPGSSPGIGSGGGTAGSFFYIEKDCGISSVGRALASQAEGRGFESRIPLKVFYGITLFYADISSPAKLS